MGAVVAIESKVEPLDELRAAIREIAELAGRMEAQECETGGRIREILGGLGVKFDQATAGPDDLSPTFYAHAAFAGRDGFGEWIEVGLESRDFAGIKDDAQEAEGLLDYWAKGNARSIEQGVTNA